MTAEFEPDNPAPDPAAADEADEAAAPTAMRPRVLPWVVLACTLLSTTAVAYYVWSKDRLRADSAAREAARAAHDRIQGRLDGYVGLLRGAAGLIVNRLPEGADRMPAHRGEFATYVERLELRTHYPGVQGLGFALRLRPDEREGFEGAMRRTAGAAFRVWSDPPAQPAAPAGPAADDLHPIVLLEPPDERNRAAIGFDMFSEPVRREAMARARDTAAPAASGVVVLKQEIDEQRRQNGFLIYLPVYHTGQAPADVPARRAELAGFVYAPFRTRDLLNGIFGEAGTDAPIDFSVYDGDTLLDRTDDDAEAAAGARAALDPRTDTAPADVKRTIDVAGRQWTLRLRPRARPELSFRPVVVPAIVLAGSALAGLLFLLTRSEGRARLRAEEVAAELRRSREDLRRANDSLRESESRIRTLTDSNIVGMLIGDVSGRIHETNDAFLRLIGYTREDAAAAAAAATPLDWRRLTAPEFLPGVEAAMEVVQRTGRNVPYEKEFLRRDGTRVPVLVGKAYLGGADRRFVAFVLDLTERKRAERALRDSENQLRLVTDSLPVLVGYIDAGGRFRFANRHYEQWFGVPTSGIVGRPLREVIGEEAYVQRRAYIEAALRGETVRFHGSLPHQDGTVRETEITYIPDLDPAGVVRGFVGLIADVTEQRRTEQALRRYGDLFQHAGLGLLVTGPDGVTLEMANPAFASLCGLPPDGLAAGRSVLDAFAPEYRTEVPSHLRIARERGHHTFESTFQRPDGVRLPVEVDVTAVQGAAGGADAVVYHILSVTDITARERDERERERLLSAEQAARAEAEAANRSKDEFLATLSHELRTPLNAMLGWAQLLRMGGVAAEEFAHGLETIERNARAQGQLVEDLLDLSRIISGKLRLDVAPVDLPAVVEAALEAVRPAAEAKGIRVVPVFDAHAGPVRGDAGRLQQVAWNLLSNAIKFTPRDGQVQVVLAAGPDGQAELSVTDTGEGIAPAFLPHVFDRLRQADASTTRKHGGLGLGLSIVRHLVELHGGTVEARSPGAGRGSTFTVRLPLAAEREPSMPAGGEAEPDRAGQAEGNGEVRPAMPSLAGVRAVVVEDDADTRELIARVLRQCGAEVTAAVGSAREGAEALAATRPDVLLSDIGMPEEDGYSLIRRVRAMPDGEGGRTPAIALTAFARHEDRARALAEGFQLHVAKPVEPAELAGAVAQLVASDRNGEGKVEVAGGAVEALPGPAA